VVWSIILIIYIVPFWVWQVSRNETTIKVRKNLYPGPKQEFTDESVFWKISAAWCLGLVLLLIAYKL
jgi:hypothetical protein